MRFMPLADFKTKGILNIDKIIDVMLKSYQFLSNFAQMVESGICKDEESDVSGGNVLKEEINRMTADDEFDIVDILLVFLKYLRKYAVWIVLTGILCTAVAGIGTKYLVRPLYKATVTMYVYNIGEEKGTITNSDIQVAESLLNTYQEILKSDTVLESACSRLGDDAVTVKALRDMLSIEIVKNTQVLSVGVISEDPAQAQTVANTIAAVAPQEIIRITKAGSVEIVDYAKQPQAPINNHILRNAAIGFLAGVSVLSAALLLKGLTTNTIYSESDIERLSEYPVLGGITVIKTADTPNKWKIYERGTLSHESKKTQQE